MNTTTGMSAPVKTILIFVIAYYKNVLSALSNSTNLELQSPSPIIPALFRKHTLHVGIKVSTLKGKKVAQMSHVTQIETCAYNQPM